MAVLVVRETVQLTLVPSSKELILKLFVSEQTARIRRHGNMRRTRSAATAITIAQAIRGPRVEEHSQLKGVAHSTCHRSRNATSIQARLYLIKELSPFGAVSHVHLPWRKPAVGRQVGSL
jgi:hypothetical protein